MLEKFPQAFRDSRNSTASDPALTIPPTMHTSAEMAKALNRPVVFLNGLQKSYDLPAFEGTAYPDAYLAFLRSVIFLRMLGISQETLLKLWRLEKKLLTLLHADSVGSPTWFLDSCGPTTSPHHRLLLSNFDMGFQLKSQAVQLGLDFTEGIAPELFDGKEMGEDALRVLGQYLEIHTRVQKDIRTEIPLLRKAARWGARFG